MCAGIQYRVGSHRLKAPCHNRIKARGMYHEVTAYVSGAYFCAVLDRIDRGISGNSDLGAVYRQSRFGRAEMVIVGNFGYYSVNAGVAGYRNLVPVRVIIGNYDVRSGQVVGHRNLCRMSQTVIAEYIARIRIHIGKAYRCGGFFDDVFRFSTAGIVTVSYPNRHDVISAGIHGNGISKGRHVRRIIPHFKSFVRYRYAVDFGIDPYGFAVSLFRSVNFNIVADVKRRYRKGDFERTEVFAADHSVRQVIGHGFAFYRSIDRVSSGIDYAFQSLRNGFAVKHYLVDIKGDRHRSIRGTNIQFIHSQRVAVINLFGLRIDCFYQVINVHVPECIYVLGSFRRTQFVIGVFESDRNIISRQVLTRNGRGAVHFKVLNGIAEAFQQLAAGIDLEYEMQIVLGKSAVQEHISERLYFVQFDNLFYADGNESASDYVEQSVIFCRRSEYVIDLFAYRSNIIFG